MKFKQNFVFYINILFSLTNLINGQMKKLCSNFPCKNNSICIETKAGYSCFCTYGYIGKNCGKNIYNFLGKNYSNNSTFFKKLSAKLCKNDGRLVFDSKLNKMMCQCKPGTSGNYCEILEDSCISNPCRGNGICRSFINLYACSCFPDYTGKNCEIKLSNCLSDPCKNNANCIDHSFGFVCECKMGFSGSLCQFKNDCSSSP